MRPRTLNEIASAVADYFYLSVADLVGKDRTAYTATARHVFMFIAFNQSMRAMTTIAAFLDNRDHSTVVHGVARIAERITRDEVLAGQVAEITEQLKAKSREVPV